MKRIVLALSPLLLLAAGSSSAADAQVCYSPYTAQYQTGGFGTTTYPQLTNTTAFACKSGVQYTLSQLAARGWKINQVVPTQYSITTNADGTVKSVTRYQAIISN